MGTKGSKGIAKNERTEIIQQARKTITNDISQNERASLANQFQRASSINIEAITTSCSKKYKNFVSLMKKDDLVGIIKILTARKIGINEILDSTYKMTPLHLAAMLRKPEIVRSLLCSLEIDINAVNKDGDTPLLLALKSSNVTSGLSDEQSCILTISILIEDKRCQLARVNYINASPLSVAVAKGFSSVVNLLVSNNRIRAYSAMDIAMAIKLAIIYDKDELVDVIFNEMDGLSKQEFISLLEQNPELKSLGRHLQELDIKNKKQPLSEPESKTGIPEASNYSTYSDQEEDEDDFDDDNKHDNTIKAQNYDTSPNLGPMVTISTTADTLAQKSTKDSLGQPIFIGNLIEIGNVSSIRTHNPRIKSEIDFIEGIAGQRAYVLDIDAEGDMYVDVISGHNYAGHINSKCTQLIESGPKIQLEDGQFVSIGYYVQINPNHKLVQSLAVGHGGWKEVMKEFCGKTGQIRKIDRAGDVFVHFPSRQRHCFNSRALLGSSASDIEAKDINGDIIRKGAFARVTTNKAEFKLLQTEISLEYDEKYTEILGKLVKVRKLRLFLQYCDALVLIDSKSYYVNPKCLQILPCPKDCNDEDLAIGDSVRVLTQKYIVRSLQSSSEFGGDRCWIDGKIENLLGKTGVIIDIDVLNSTGAAVVTKVEFPGAAGGTFDLNPKIVEKRKSIFNNHNNNDGSNENQYNLSSSASPSSNLYGKKGVGYSPSRFGSSSPSSHSPRRGSSPNVTSYSSNGEDPGYYGSMHGLHEQAAFQNERKGSCASVLSNSSSYCDGLKIIARKDLEMKKKLGEGGFGCVTSGSWRGTDCAIKQIRPIVTSDIDYDDILKEARIQYGLKHPNIVQLYGISYENDLWMVMQLVNGMDLHSILFGRDSNGNKEKIAYSFKIKISVQATNAISYLHEKGFLHNDIKPENLMIEKKTGNVLICDFGITRYLGRTDLYTYSQKYTSSFGGTLPYIAPECYQKDPIKKKYLRPTFKSDIWALGAVFTELFTEKELFPTDKLLVQCKIMNDYSGIKLALKPIVDSNIKSMLKKCLDANPDVRPTAEDMNRILFDIMRQK